MGKKTSAIKISALRALSALTIRRVLTCGLGLGWSLFLANNLEAWATVQAAQTKEPTPAAQDEGLSIRSDFRVEDQPLTTDLLVTLDPVQVNPQRMNWFLHRTTQLSGVTTTKKKNEKFGVSAQGLLVTTRGYLRAEGLRFKRIEDFLCGSDTKFSASPAFSTYEGNKLSLNLANEEWSKLLKEESTKLVWQLSRLESPTDAGVRELAERVFTRWLGGVDQSWRYEKMDWVRSKEWKGYAQEATQKKICPLKKGLKVPKPESLSEMEPLQGEPPKITQILARVPVRLWNGHFSVRVDFVLGDRALNGRFLIDPGAPVSVISPVWLENQGVYSAWVEAPDLLPSQVRWSIPPKDPRGSMLANWAHFDFVRISGLKVPIQDFLLFNTDFYGPPEFVGGCCDGVLGVDFLRAFPIEFQAENPPELRIWPKENFNWGTQQTAKDLFETPRGISETLPLLSKGTFTLDLPHGRIWFSRGYEPYELVNRSGLKLTYKTRQGDRVLVVSQLSPKTPAAKLAQAGLKVGMVITQFDSKDPADLDEWQINRKLSGDSGPVLSLQWEVKGGVLKMAPLEVPVKTP